MKNPFLTQHEVKEAMAKKMSGGKEPLATGLPKFKDVADPKSKPMQPPMGAVKRAGASAKGATNKKAKRTKGY